MNRPRPLALVVLAGCAFDTSGPGGGLDGGDTDGPSTTSASTSDGPTTSASTTMLSGSGSDGTTSDPSGTSTPSTTVDPSEGSSGDEADSTGAATSGTDPTDESSTTETGDAIEICDGLDNDGDGGIDEGSPANPVCGGCTFVPSSDGVHWFAVCADGHTWDAARTRCADFGPSGDLAKIENAIDQTALLALVAVDHWVGLEDLQTDGLWFWVDGTAARVGAMVIGYDGWGAMQPDGQLAENCAELDPGQFGWADSPCGQTQPIVCRHDG